LGRKGREKRAGKLVDIGGVKEFYLEGPIRGAVEGHEDELPNTVVAMVQSRLGALSDGDRRLLRAASIFGETFWTRGVASLLGGISAVENGVDDKLRALVEKELFTRRAESRFPNENEYTFRHALLREGAYAMLTEEDRTLGHRLAGEWLEVHGEKDALLLAEHFEKGTDFVRAGQYYFRAAETANRAGDSEAAILRARAGLRCGGSNELRIGLLGLLCESHMWQLGRMKDAWPEAEEVLSLSRPGSKTWAQGAIIKVFATFSAGNIDALFGIIKEIRETDPEDDAMGLMVQALIVVAQLLCLMGQLDHAREARSRITTLVATADEPDPFALAWESIDFVVGAVICEERELHRGLLAASKGLGYANAVGNRRLAQSAHLLRGMVLWELGAFVEAEEAHASADVPDHELGAISAIRPFSLAIMLAGRGEFTEARNHAMALIESGRARKVAQDEQLGHLALAEVLLRAGDMDGAEHEMQAAVALLEHCSPLNKPETYATLAALRLARGRPAEALAAAEEGVAHFERLGACIFNRGRMVGLMHAECLKACGRDDEARVRIERLKGRVLELADTLEGPEVRETFLREVPENRRILQLAAQWASASA